MEHAQSVATPLFSHRPFWAHRFGVAPELPMTREEMDELGWDSCDIIIVTGDSYVDHPSFGMAVMGRLLESQGFRVGIISQPDWRSTDDFMKLGCPNLFFGITAGNMDSMVNHFTSDRKIRRNDAYTPNGDYGKRPDRAVIVYTQRCREAYQEIPLVIGGIESSLRRIAHYDYWSDKVRRSILLDSKADILLYGNAERAVVMLAHRLAASEPIEDITDLRGTVVVKNELPQGYKAIDSTTIDPPGIVDSMPDPYAMKQQQAAPGNKNANCDLARKPTFPGQGGGLSTSMGQQNSPQDVGPSPSEFTTRQIVHADRSQCYIRLPAFEKLRHDPVLYAHTSRLLHVESNPGNARVLVQQHGNRDVWINPPPIPLTTKEMDRVFELPYTRKPHHQYGDQKIPAYEMIRFSVTITRGCFGGCTFCSITEHEGRIIQNRSEASILREIETIRDTVPGFTGIISDLGGPTANMYRLHCKSPKIESACRRLSCVFPGICSNLKTDHTPLVNLYRKARKVKGVKKVLIASGVRYDLAVESPEYVRELVSHHVGGYLKIAPEHTESGPLNKMMKPGIGTYDKFKLLFDKFSKEAGKEQYLIPYFIAGHPGTTDEDMMHLAIWLKNNGFRADQVQAFLPSPMAMATAMYHSEKNPLGKIRRESEEVYIPKGLKQRRLHKAFLRYHDPENWPVLREALKAMGREDLIGNGKHHLVPTFQPKSSWKKGKRKPRQFKTQHVR